MAVRTALAALASGLLLSSPLMAQFAADRVPMPITPPTSPSETLSRTPIVPTAATAPATASPASTLTPAVPVFPTTATAISPNAGAPTAAATAGAPPAAAPAQAHPWAVRPEHGPFMISVKSFTGPQARQLAEELAQEIREHHKAAAYLFEWGAEERRKEEARQEAYRQAWKQQNAPFLQLREEMRKKAEAEGRIFIDTPPTMRIPQVKYTEQWAVLVGGFPDMDAASAALKYLRSLPPATVKTHLLDRAVVTSPSEQQGGKSSVQAAYLSVYAQAFVTPNPAINKSRDKPQYETDEQGTPLLKTWNEAEPYSLLNCPGSTTLVVKVFSVPARTKPAKTEKSVLERLFTGSDSKKMLDATAKQAHELAKALRSPNMAESLRKMGMTGEPLEAYVLHTRTGSLVTVGAFASENDPQLLRVKQILESMSFQVQEQAGGPVIRTERMFAQVFPMTVPKLP